jgi:putative ABC transport system permease protein
MIRFLDVLSIILAAIALISLLVGGMGITNMMLVSVAERMKEIGIRKAVGATYRSIRMQFVIESMVLCLIAGIAGLLFGFLGSEAAIYVASKLTPKLAFEWRFDSAAMLLSVLSIVVVGVLSGLSPALKAEKVNVVEALRAE